MENIFNFNYQTDIINNIDGTPSRFSVVYGDEGKVVHTKKDRYTIVQTSDVQELANRFIDKNMKVKGFSHRYGEVIGLNIELIQNRKTVIGDKSYNAIITIPNNGGGSGYLSISEMVLVCLNGMTRSTLKHKDVSIKIPHNLDYKNSLKLMEDAILSFKELIYDAENRDRILNNTQLADEDELTKHLNRWFYDHEIPESQKAYSFDEFRKMLVDERDKIKMYGRYEQLIAAKNRELNYNIQLKRPLSMYTVYASITNYLSRRREASKGEAPTEIQMLRQEEKIKKLEHVLVN